MTTRIFVTRQIPAAGLELLSALPEAKIDIWPGRLPPPPDVLRQKVRGLHGLLCLLTDAIDEALLEAAGPSLRVVSQMAVGVDNIDLTACARRGIAVGHTPGVLTESTADLTLALLLAAARQLFPAAEAVKQGEWRTWEPMGFTGPDVFGSTVGIVGMGRIGLAVARRLQGFSVRLLYHNRRPSPAAEEVGATWVDLDTLLAESDFVSLHCPSTPKTHHLLNAVTLSKMKPAAILINTARGDVVDQPALVDALRRGVIAGAGLDVTTPEPLPADDPLLGLPNVVVLPHIGSASLSAREKMANIAARNLIAGLRGEPLPYAVKRAA